MLNSNPMTCPGCGLDYLHHEQVEIFPRPREDAERYVGFEVSREGLRTIPPDANPSSRRDGLRIWFSCEGCDLLSPCSGVTRISGLTGTTCSATTPISTGAFSERLSLAVGRCASRHKHFFRTARGEGHEPREYVRQQDASLEVIGAVQIWCD